MLLTAVMACVAAACGGGELSEQRLEIASDLESYMELELHEVGSYGILQDASGAPAGGGVLAQIAGIAETADGTVFILDAAFKKVAVFAADGHLRNVILGGHGEGPGEFIHPTALSVSLDGRIAVFDYSQDRVTLFSDQGSLLEVVQAPRTKDIVLTGDWLVGSYMPGRTYMIWSRKLPDEGLRELIPVPQDHFAFSPFGTVARLGVTQTGQVLIAHHRPGLWALWDPGTSKDVRFRGMDLLSGRTARRVDNVEWTPGASVGIGSLTGRHIAIAYTVRDFTTAIPTERFLIDIFTADGTRVAQVDLGARFTTGFAVGSDGVSVLLAEYEPFPRVVRYELVQCQDAAPCEPFLPKVP